ncbi:glutathione peroxidase [Sphingomonas jatrophae]|uniref:Glutathione peroxidase n=1 Tax=Sphingomonas jatrophae TaxID=1166337 RepID=A0A1I6MAT8_9SPHN|nr:glutathione peroxidase [Sphingomonas jatrophae]SFS12672.1 glutathione peroxidase [Sphingomonas jatrophae]
MKRSIALGIAGFVLAGAAVGYAQFPKTPPTPPLPTAQAARLTAWDFRLTAIDGAPMPLSQYRGKVVLLVNTASFCGFKKQFAGLQQLQDTYAKRGFVLIGVPSGSFKDQEYGSNKEIADHCNTTGIRFPMAEKAPVVGPGALPIYRWAAAKVGGDNTPRWNFHKYLIGRDGRRVTPFGTMTDPSDPKLHEAIEAALKQRA